MQHDPQPFQRDDKWFGTNNQGAQVGPYDSEYAVRLWHQVPWIGVRGDEDAV
jgi:hypothetical protein